jgi:hypothetical protein
MICSVEEMKRRGNKVGEEGGMSDKTEECDISVALRTVWREEEVRWRNISELYHSCSGGT